LGRLRAKRRQPNLFPWDFASGNIISIRFHLFWPEARKDEKRREINELRKVFAHLFAPAARRAGRTANLESLLTGFRAGGANSRE